MANKFNQYKQAKRYQAKQNMLAKIHREIAPELDAMRRADAILDNCTKGRPETGRNETEAGSLDKYNVSYRMGTIPGSLARENDNFASLRVASMNKAGEDTRNLAGGSHSRE